MTAQPTGLRACPEPSRGCCTRSPKPSASAAQTPKPSMSPSTCRGYSHLLDSRFPLSCRASTDRRILIAQKDGTIQVANANGELQSTPLITLATDSSGTRGLLGIAVDPNY